MHHLSRLSGHHDCFQSKNNGFSVSNFKHTSLLFLIGYYVLLLITVTNIADSLITDQRKSHIIHRDTNEAIESVPQAYKMTA